MGCLLLAAACRPAPPKPPADFGVHVASARSDSAPVHFTVHVSGTLQLGIRARIVAMEPDKSLLLATPADLVVNKGLGSVVLTAADTGDILAVTPLDHTDSSRVTARAHAVRVSRIGDTRQVTASPDTTHPSPPEVPR